MAQPITMHILAQPGLFFGGKTSRISSGPGFGQVVLGNPSLINFYTFLPYLVHISSNFVSPFKVVQYQKFFI